MSAPKPTAKQTAALLARSIKKPLKTDFINRPTLSASIEKIFKECFGDSVML